MKAQSRPERRLAACAAHAILLVIAAVVIAGCASSHIGDQVPTAMGGLPEAAPSRPATPYTYPAVHEMPPPRETKVLTSEEQQQLEEELAAARNRAAAANGSAAKPAGARRNQ